MIILQKNAKLFIYWVLPQSDLYNHRFHISENPKQEMQSIKDDPGLPPFAEAKTGQKKYKGPPFDIF
jgi:hypothetical protein